MLPYIPNGEREKEVMLKSMGLSSIDELFKDIPNEVRLNRRLNLGPPMPELELASHKLDVEETSINKLVPDDCLRKEDALLPEVSELDVVRHYTLLSNKNYSVDKGFYPLGSCTMKYNPKRNEDMASLSGFSNIHPLQPEKTV